MSEIFVTKLSAMRIDEVEKALLESNLPFSKMIGVSSLQGCSFSIPLIAVKIVLFGSGISIELGKSRKDWFESLSNYMSDKKSHHFNLEKVYVYSDGRTSLKVMNKGSADKVVPELLRLIKCQRLL